MGANRFDAFSRSLAQRAPRRLLLRGLAGSALGAAAGHRPTGATARKRKLRRNEFGCVPVGKPCRGKDGVCCSGICRGQKPKRGKKDESRCVGHDESTCQPGQREASCFGTDVLCTTSTGSTGVCNTTTGDAAYCRVGALCTTCATDAECQVRYGDARAACIRCPVFCPTGTACGLIAI